MKKKISFTQLILTLTFIVTFLVSNIIATKQIRLPFDIVMTGAIIVFPLTYILSDVFSEVYGYKYSRLTSYCAFAFNVLMVCIFELAIILPSAETFGNQESFELILGSSLKVLIASLTAYLVGDFINDRVFKRLKKDSIRFETRAILSSISGEFVDSLIFIPIVFASVLPVKEIIVMIVIQPVIKVLYEIVILPITKLVVYFVKKLESENLED